MSREDEFMRWVGYAVERWRSGDSTAPEEVLRLTDVYRREPDAHASPASTRVDVDTSSRRS